VEIAASPEGDHTGGLQAFVSKIEPLIEGRSSPADALNWFPQENLVSVRLVPESVLGLRQLKRGYVAKYAQGQAFIVTESSPESAVEVFKKVQARFPDATPAKLADDSFQAKSQYLDSICIFRKGRYIAGFANEPSREAALVNATNLASRLP